MEQDDIFTAGSFWATSFVINHLLFIDFMGKQSRSGMRSIHIGVNHNSKDSSCVPNHQQYSIHKDSTSGLWMCTQLTAWRCDCESQGAEGPDMQENRPYTVPLLVASGQLSRQSKKIGLSRITTSSRSNSICNLTLSM